jgi:hypothetical protein
VTVVGKKAFNGMYPCLSDGIIRRGLHDYLVQKEGARGPGQEKVRQAV